jgi:AAA+ ATPase superfamily predicted ATPase
MAMSTVMDIFDREDIQLIIRNNCLRAEKGVGTVVYSPQKSGKSHLLQYIYYNRPEQVNTLYCWISVDHLGTRVRPDGELSDEIFLRYFLEQLHQDLKNYLQRERQKEEDERAKLAKHEEQLKSGPVLDFDFQQIVEVSLKSTKTYLNQMEVLHKSKDKIGALLVDDKAPDDIYGFLIELLDDLKRAKKAVVIFIDDVDKIIGNHKFSKTLLSLLRGASDEGKLVPLLSTPLQLMHPSLHQRERGEQTRSLFNIVKVEVLNSFTDEEACKFLNWPKPPEPPFTNEELQYLIDFAGGSPYFLGEVLEKFLRTRPPPSARAKFEVDAFLALEAALETVWNRCTPEQQDALLAVHGSHRPADPLGLGPAACFARPKGLATILTPFLKAKAAYQPGIIAVATPAFSVFPMALCIADPGSLRPLVTVTLKNNTRRGVKVGLECELEQFSLKSPQIAEVPPGASTDVPLRIRLKADVLGIKNPVHTQIHWKAVLNPGHAGSDINEGTFDVSVLALDQFLFAYQDPAQNTLSHSAWLIASWVNTEADGIQELAKKALQEAKKALQETQNEIGFVAGYPNNVGPAADEVVTAQVRALYHALRDKEGGITYYNRTAVPFTDQIGDKTSLSQKVRLPARSLKEGCANCLDGAVLFASLLSALDLDPLILFMPDHALVGWNTSRGPTAEKRFLDIVNVSEPTKDFVVACRNGEALYSRVKDLIRDDDEAEIVNPTSFAVLVDIRAAQQNRRLGFLPVSL